MKPLRPWKVITGILVIFTAGAVVGSVATTFSIRRAFERSLKWEHWRTGAMEAIQDRLKLTPDQRIVIAAIFDETGAEMHQIFGRTLEDCSHLLLDTQRRIDEELTPEQRIIHARMKDEFRATLKRKLNYDLPPEPVVPPAHDH